jgi:hypothetical protein
MIRYFEATVSRPYIGLNIPDIRVGFTIYITFRYPFAPIVEMPLKHVIEKAKRVPSRQWSVPAEVVRIHH